MPILKDFNEGSMDKLKSLKYSDFGVKPPYVQKDEGFQYNQLNARTTDLQRFAKLLTSKPGLKFQASQALLQQEDTLKELKSASKKKGGGFNTKGLLKAAGKKVLNTAVNNIATTASILAQIPVNGTGTHFIQGLTPSGYLQSGAPRNTGLGQFLEQQGIGGGVNGAKSVLNGESVGSSLGGPLSADTVLLQKYQDGEVSPKLSHPSLQTIQAKKATSITTVPSILDDAFEEEDLLAGLSTQLEGLVGPPVEPYLGEVSSNKFLNKDNIPNLPSPISTTVVREGKSQHFLKNTEYNVPYFTPFSLDDSGVQTISTTYPKKPFEGNNSRFDNPTYNVKVDSKGTTKSYLTAPVNIESRLGLEGNKDQINTTYNIRTQSEELLGKNIIPFSFNVITPDQEFFLYFRALLDSLDDDYTGNWNATKYIGRAENFYTYDGFDRGISFSFKAAAFSQEELKPLYEKLNYLAGTTAPTYSPEGNFMRGTLVTLSIGEYLDKVTGYISSVKLSWKTEYPWEIDLYKENLPIVPHLLDVSVSFVPIHDFNVKSNINVTTGDVYIGPKVPKKKLPPKKETTNTENVYFEGKTITVDKDTRKTLRVNNQKIPKDYQQYGVQYDPQFERTVHISPDGKYKFNPVSRKWVTNNLPNNGQ